MYPLAMLMIGLGIAITTSGEPVFPGSTWQHRTPEEVGMSAEGLKAFSDCIGGLGCVTRHGYMVYSWGDPTARRNVASACKPFYCHFLFRAVEDGKLGGVDDYVGEFEPRLDGLNPDLGYKDRNIRWRDLANQVSCYGVTEAPGTAFDYNDFNMALFFDTLFLKVYGVTWETVDDQVLHPMLTDPIGCQDDPTFMSSGTDRRQGRVGISCRDFCRVGLLYLRGGRWEDRQLIRAEDVRMAVSTPVPNAIPRTQGQEAEMIPGQRSIGGGRNQGEHLGSYSFAWWINGVTPDGRRQWWDAPADTFAASGNCGKRFMVVMPSLGIVASWNDGDINEETERTKENEALGLLARAVTNGAPDR